jgi:hypothetical protein
MYSISFISQPPNHPHYTSIYPTHNRHPSHLTCNPNPIPHIPFPFPSRCRNPNTRHAPKFPSAEAMPKYAIPKCNMCQKKPSNQRLVSVLPSSNSSTSSISSSSPLSLSLLSPSSSSASLPSSSSSSSPSSSPTIPGTFLHST